MSRKKEERRKRVSASAGVRSASPAEFPSGAAAESVSATDVLNITFILRGMLASLCSLDDAEEVDDLMKKYLHCGFELYYYPDEKIRNFPHGGSGTKKECSSRRV